MWVATTDGDDERWQATDKQADATDNSAKHSEHSANKPTHPAGYAHNPSTTPSHGQTNNHSNSTTYTHAAHTHNTQKTPQTSELATAHAITNAATKPQPQTSAHSTANGSNKETPASALTLRELWRTSRKDDHMYKSIAERIKANISVNDGGCWEWQRRKDKDGYGVMWIGAKPDRKIMFAHRVSYAEMVGEIPNGLQLDHLCRNRSCVNPEHLEPVTSAENTKRGLISRGNENFCQNGHQRTAENTRINPSGYKACRPCHAANMRRYRSEAM